MYIIVFAITFMLIFLVLNIIKDFLVGNKNVNTSINNINTNHYITKTCNNETNIKIDKDLLLIKDKELLDVFKRKGKMLSKTREEITARAQLLRLSR